MTEMVGGGSEVGDEEGWGGGQSGRLQSTTTD